MKRSFTKKKESGAKGWKRQKLEAEEAKKSNKFLMTFFEKHGSCSTSSMELIASSTSLLESQSESSTNAQVEKKIK